MGRLVSCGLVNETKERIPRSVLRACVQETVKQHSRDGIFSLNIVFVSQEKIRKLNKIYRDKDVPTDVLSFSTEDGSQSEADQLMAGAKISGGESVDGGDSSYLGEIVICPAYIRKHAQRDMRWELCHVVVHGTFHLLGKHHEHSEKTHQKMHNLEEKIIDKVLDR